MIVTCIYVCWQDTGNGWRTVCHWSQLFLRDRLLRPWHGYLGRRESGDIFPGRHACVLFHFSVRPVLPCHINQSVTRMCFVVFIDSHSSFVISADSYFQLVFVVYLPWYRLATSILKNRYGDSVDNTVEENSSIFSLIRMRWLLSARACGQ